MHDFLFWQSRPVIQLIAFFCTVCVFSLHIRSNAFHFCNKAFRSCYDFLDNFGFGEFSLADSNSARQGEPIEILEGRFWPSLSGHMVGWVPCGPGYYSVV